MKSRILKLTNVISPDGENMDLDNAPESVREMILSVINAQSETESYTLTGHILDADGRIWRWEY